MSWTLTITLLSDEAVAFLARRLIEAKFGVAPGLGDSMYVQPDEGTTWEGRVVVLKLTKDGADMATVGAEIKAAASLVNYLSLVLVGNGESRVAGPHFVDHRPAVPAPTVYDKIGGE